MPVSAAPRVVSCNSVRSSESSNHDCRDIPRRVRMCRRRRRLAAGRDGFLVRTHRRRRRRRGRRFRVQLGIDPPRLDGVRTHPDAVIPGSAGRVAGDQRCADPGAVLRRDDSHTQTDVKILATGLAAGILVDATIVRCLLVAALVALFGRYDWWLPRWMATFLRVELSRCRRTPWTHPADTEKQCLSAPTPAEPRGTSPKPATPTPILPGSARRRSTKRHDVIAEDQRPASGESRSGRGVAGGVTRRPVEQEPAPGDLPVHHRDAFGARRAFHRDRLGVVDDQRRVLVTEGSDEL
jgi:hypothetical protein